VYDLHASYKYQARGKQYKVHEAKASESSQSKRIQQLRVLGDYLQGYIGLKCNDYIAHKEESNVVLKCDKCLPQ